MARSLTSSRRTIGAVLLAASVALLSACGGSSEGSPSASTSSTDNSSASSEPVTLRVQQQTGQEKLFGFLAEEFQKKYPNVTVKLETISQEQKTGSNLQVLGSSNAPDVGFVPIGSNPYVQLIAAQQLESLSDVWTEADLDKRYGQALSDSLKTNGNPYAAVFSAAIYNVIWYNPDAFTKAGITAPTDHRVASTQDLLDIAQKLRAAGLAPLQIAGASNYQASWMIDAILPTSATADQANNYLTSYNKSVEVTAKYTDPAFQNVIDTLKSYADGGVFQDGFTGVKDAAQALAPFYAGKAGMALGGNFTSPDFAKNNLKFKPDWFLLPPFNAGAKTVQTTYYGDALGIPVSAAQKDWAKKFIAFAVSDEMQEKAVIGVGGILPAVNSLPDSAYSALDADTQAILADVKTNGSVPGWTSTVPGAFGQQFIDPNLQKMYTGSISAADVASKQQAELDKVRGS